MSTGHRAVRRLAVSLAVLTPPALHAQTPRDTVQLPPLVVTATRFLAPRDQVPNAVTVIDGVELERRGITRVLDALRSVPGVAVVQSGSPGAVTSLFLRGGESDYVRVLVDGVPVNQPGGSINLADVTTDNVARIEIVRGPVSALYGSDAIGGVINVITRQGGAPAHAAASVRATSRGTVVAGSVAGGAPGVSYSVGGSRSEEPGAYRLNNRYRAWSASGLVRATPDARTDVQVSMRHQDGVFHYPTDYTGAPVDSNQYTTGALTVVGVDAGRSLSERVEARVLLGATSGVDRAVNERDSPNDLDFTYAVRTPYGRRSADAHVVVRTAGRGAIVVGGALESERFRGAGDSVDLTRDNRAVYAQFTGPAELPGTIITAGMRLEDNERFGTFLTLRAGFTSRLGASTIVRGGAGTAFKEPTFYENYGGGYSVGNPDLAPERSLSGEVGLEQPVAAGRLRFGFTLFAQRFDWLIQYSPSGPAGSPQYHNLAGAEARGLEVELAAVPWRGASLAASWTWLHTVVRDSGAGGGGFDDGKPLIRRPAHSGSLSLDQNSRALDAGITVSYVGRRDDLDYRASFAGERTAMRPHARVDLRLAWRLGAPYAVTAQIENALNERYAEVLGYPARSRTIWLGARVTAP